ncbi:hypothetical protein C6500_21350 [Candidatus Poribacteria bacterium]|nr:MAG: hypothetical protein C6500_21350 [Candidatus Poribacteria bacterium]
MNQSFLRESEFPPTEESRIRGLLSAESRKLKSESQYAESGFTLVEMLMAVSILVIIGGSAYFAFKTAVDAYHQTEEKILAAQRSRVAMDRLVTDLSNMRTSLEDPELALYTQDGPSQFGDRDMLSFVTLVKTDPDPFLEQLASFRSLNASQTPLPLLSDVQRVAYFVGSEPLPGESTLSLSNFQESLTGETIDAHSGGLALFRVTTTVLDPEVVIGALLQTGQVPETDENGEPIYVNIATLVAGLVSFDLQYFDGEAEAWRTSWDDAESLPSAVQIRINVQGEAQIPSSLDVAENTAQSQPTMQSIGMTQATMVYLPASF